MSSNLDSILIVIEFYIWDLNLVPESLRLSSGYPKDTKTSSTVIDLAGWSAIFLEIRKMFGRKMSHDLSFKGILTFTNEIVIINSLIQTASSIICLILTLKLSK